MLLTRRPSSRVVVVCGSLLFLVLALHLSSIRECDAATSTTKAPAKASTTSKPAKPAASSLAPKKKTDGSKAPSSKPTPKAQAKPSKKPVGPPPGPTRPNRLPPRPRPPKGPRAQARLYRLLMESAMINLIAKEVVGVNIQREFGDIVCVQGPNDMLLNQRLKLYRGKAKICHKGMCTKDSKSKCGKDSGVKSTGKPANAKNDPKKGPTPAGKSTPKPAPGSKSTPKAAAAKSTPKAAAAKGTTKAADKKGSGAKSTAKPATKSTAKPAPAAKSTPKAATAKSTTAKSKGSRADISEIVSSIEGDDD